MKMVGICVGRPPLNGATKEKVRTSNKKILLYIQHTVHLLSDVNDNSQVCCRNPIPEAMAIAPSAYKNVCRFDLTKFTQK